MNKNDEIPDIRLRCATPRQAEMEFADEHEAERQKSIVPDIARPGDNTQNITVSEAIRRIMADIEASDMPASKKQAVKNELEKFREYQIIS